MQLSEKRKIFSNFFLNFVNLDSILHIFQIKITLKVDAFLNLRTLENVVR